MSEKTHQPTSRRLRQAREKGQVPYSPFWTSAGVLVGAWTGVLLGVSWGTSRLLAFTATMFERPHLTAPAALREAGIVLFSFVAPALTGAFLGGLASGAAMVGLEFNASLALPQLERVNPAAGLKQLFSLKRLVQVAKAILVMGLLALLVFVDAKSFAPEVIRTWRSDVETGLVSSLWMLRTVVIHCLVLFSVIGAGDYMLARRRHLKELMMTREDVKREHKENEGDPYHKAARKGAHRQYAMGGPARGVEKATAVVVNPTHVAVALRYQPKESDAPYLVAKGLEYDALAMRRDAERFGVPIVRNVPLARSLIHYDVGEEIPEELYQAVAAVLKAAMEQRDAQAQSSLRRPTG